MADHELTPLQANQILLAVRDAGLTPSDFEWIEEHTKATHIDPGSLPFMIPVLIHRPSGYAFAFDVGPGKHHYARFRPGLGGDTTYIEAADWTIEMGFVRRWLSSVKENHQAPDLWAEATRADTLATVLPSGAEDNSPFSFEEQRLISQQLQELNELISQLYETRTDRIPQLKARLEYLARASSRLGRFDWRNVLLAQLVSLVFDGTIAQPTLPTVAHFVARGLGHLFGGGQDELPNSGSPPA